MEEAEIYDVRDDSPRRTLRNPDLSSWTGSVGEVLAQFGWALLLLCSALYLLVQFLKKRRREGGSEEPVPETGGAAGPEHLQQNLRRGPEICSDLNLLFYEEGRAEALEAARRRMQEELDCRAALYKEKMRQQEEQKRRQRIETWESIRSGRSYRETTSSQASEDADSSSAPKPKKDKKPLRSADYSPLSGQAGGSCSWRPGRRGPSSGG
ncbi:Selenoprotein S [Oryzias melastigma]|uniref:Selenoprotein S n=1 Tax=Oryzias melastigma TaxID=30732 RepID=A0A834FNH2_ORYME|nr:Selenoprotein S [Oryzias melastigma]